ncbi:His Kinase A (phospho-acceptor) domain-containing protein [Geopseudomonas sagittaria]|uniref:histidine kinase n=1 Tax=Geopseudomonas sagittaria TaxID=1135990 RepID=A0A1I5TLB2_9GAMM|nr:ATP-binding protein [Pseudomonas sagittaria]SFP83862.1 His Kinase A (phospho-acceptor) domain-containing protein [Pseudomonas sagittaria]
MKNRHLIFQAYLYTLAFTLLAVAGVSLFDLLVQPAPGLHRQQSLSDGMLLAIIALLLLPALGVWLLQRRRGHPGPPSFDRRTLAAGAFGVLLSTLGWYLLNLHNVTLITEQSQLLLNRIKDSAEDTLATRLALIRRMAERWENIGSLPSDSLWQQETGSYLRDLPDLNLLAIVDANLVVRRSEQRQPAATRWLEDFLAEPQRRAWLHAVRSGRSAHLSPSQARPGDPPQALIAMPLSLPGAEGWLLVASLAVNDTLHRVLGDHLGEFVFHVHEGELQLYASLDSGSPDHSVPVGAQPLGLAQTPAWTLSTHLDRNHMYASGQYLALLVLLCGLALSFFLMVSQRLAWHAQQQAQRLLEQQQYEAAQRRIMGMISTLQPLEQILRELCLLMEQGNPRVICSVLLVDDSRQRLTIGAAPSLGERYNQAVEGLRIGEGMGACGSAAYLRQPVLVADIANDRRWQGLHQLAAEEGLHACWSTPLLAGDGALLGTFAIYQRGPLQVDTELEELVATASHLATIAIEHRNILAELERSNRELQEFAFVASHDLQEPLRKIQTFAERLQSRADALDEQSRDYLVRMSSAAARMQALIRDLLAYSRVATRREPFVHLELDRVLDEVLQDLEGTLQSSGAHIERERLPAIEGDPSQIRQLLQNLLSNAVKFHKPGELPNVRIYAENQPTGEWRLCISDNGVGFDEKYLDRIFNPFQRLHGRQQYPGTGIGLAIVKKIVERHGARLSASSQPGRGATFRVTFPASDKE